MKKIITTFLCALIGFNAYSTICYEITGSPQLLTISVVPTTDYNAPSNIFSTGLFTLSWDASLGATVIQGINATSNLPYTFDPAGGASPQLISGKYYQKFGFATSATQTLSSGISLSILEITVSSASVSTGDFEIVETPPIVGGDAAIINFFNEQFASGGCNLVATNVPLPLELIWFAVRKKENVGALLQWQTANEENVSKFVIEKSKEGIDFNSIGEERALNEVSNDYQFMDNNIKENGIYYYRLKMMDLDDSFEYSPIRNLIYDAQFDVSIFPNPANQYIEAQFPESSVGIILEVFNMDGKVIYRQELKNENQTHIDSSNWTNGMYVIILEKNGEILNSYRINVMH